MKLTCRVCKEPFVLSKEDEDNLENGISLPSDIDICDPCLVDRDMMNSIPEDWHSDADPGL